MRYAASAVERKGSMSRSPSCSHSAAWIAVLTLTPAIAIAGVAADGAPEPDEVVRRAMRTAHFIENVGQWTDPMVRFGLRSRGLAAAFCDSTVSIRLAQGTGSAVAAERRGSLEPFEPDLNHRISGAGGSSDPVGSASLLVTFPGSNSVRPVGATPRAAKFNFFVGGPDRSAVAAAPSFGSIVYHDLYEGIDLHLMAGDGGALKYEFHCAPGADYTQVRIRYDGIESLSIDERGDLCIETTMGQLRDRAPVVWQADASKSRCARFRLIDSFTYTIDVPGTVDPRLPLTIDPEIEWMIYLGGSGADVTLQVVLDAFGNALASGNSASLDFVGGNNSNHGGDWDSTAVKVSPSGELLWMTYLGGSGDDRGRGIAVNPQNRIFVSGFTSSPDFEGRANSYHGGDHDTYLLELDGEGVLQWMKYFGGTGDDRGRVVTLTEQGEAMITGETSSADFVGGRNAYHGGDWDAFVLKTDLSGEVQWTTYFGGSDADLGYTMGIDAHNDVFLTGYTWSTDFAGRTNANYGGCDCFVLKFKATGDLAWMSYFGGSLDDETWSIAVDARGEAVAAGRTASTDFVGSNNQYLGGPSCGVVFKVSASGALQWMTYFGGSGEDGARNIILDPRGHALVTGHTDSIDFEGRINEPAGGPNDGHLLRIDPWGSLLWMMYLGGSSLDFEFGIVLDGEDHVLVAGRSTSSDFLGRINSHRGGLDGTLTRVRLGRSDPRLSVDAACPAGGPISITWSDATPGSNVALVFARGLGSFTVPPQYPCAGTTLGLNADQIRVAFQGGAGVDGSRRVGANAGPGACGGYLQLLDLTTCATSNVASID